MTVPAWVHAPSRYQQHWIRYGLLSLATSYGALWVYRHDPRPPVFIASVDLATGQMPAQTGCICATVACRARSADCELSTHAVELCCWCHTSGRSKVMFMLCLGQAFAAGRQSGHREVGPAGGHWAAEHVPRKRAKTPASAASGIVQNFPKCACKAISKIWPCICCGVRDATKQIPCANNFQTSRFKLSGTSSVADVVVVYHLASVAEVALTCCRSAEHRDPARV